MDHRAKLEWARRHFNILESAIDLFIDDKPYAATAEKDKETGEYGLRISPVRGVPADWSLQVGDIVHNLRSALDTLAFALATDHIPALTKKESRTVQFPILDTLSEFSTDPKGWLNRIPRDARAAFEKLQPYHTRHPRDKRLLAVLRDLSNEDKHRRLLVTTSVAEVQGIVAIVDGQRIPGTPAQARGFILDANEGTVVGYLTIRTPHAEVAIEANVAVHIVVRESKGVERYHDVTMVLRELLDHIREEVFPPLEKHLRRLG